MSGRPVADGAVPPLPNVSCQFGPLTRTTLALFAGASGDHNPMHIDIDFAKGAGMPDVFSHGMLVMAFMGRMLHEWAGRQNVRRWGARFTSITPVNSIIVCSAAITGRTEDGLWHANAEVTTTDGTLLISGYADIALG
jgi:acyl dehydratase